MVEIKGEFLEEVKPAFKKRMKVLLREASSKFKDAQKIIDEAKRVADLIEYDKDLFEIEVEKIVVNRNAKLLEELLGVDEPESSDDAPVLKSPIPKTRGNLPNGGINLVSGEPLKKHKGTKRTTKKRGLRRYGGKRTSVEFRGVTFEDNQYRARITIDRKAYRLGFFPTALEAAYAYDEFKYENTGSLRGLNFPDRIESRLKKKSLEG